jgi:DinB superfamily
MKQNLPDTLALLARTPAALNALLRGLPEAWTNRNEGEDTWTVFEVVAHLVHTDRADWISRVQTILNYGETQVLRSVDREGDEAKLRSMPLPQLLDEFTRVRAEKLDELRALNCEPADLERRGKHSVFGVVTLSQLLATWAAHDLTHLHQISRIMAHQYREAVGPWTRFLGVMHCEGHSKPA